MNHPVIEINSVKICNFSSPHEFRFVGGEILPACSSQIANLLKLDSKEIEQPHTSLPIVDIKLSFEMTDCVKNAIQKLENDDNIDIILVPFPVMTALKESGNNIGKCRVCRVSDRVTKTIYSDKFCI